ncbi:MAG TPA: hypothetical protein VFI31_08235, partial [Pirellulales bacterium]|nr:hypothetical protein [Pirellulales bacterium]
QFLTVLGNDVLKPWAEAKQRLTKLGSRRLGGHPGELALALKAMELREQGWNLVGDSIAAGSKEGLAIATGKFAEADQIDDDLSVTFNEDEEPKP